MLNEKQQAMSIPGITGGTVVVLLQIISRLASNGGVNDAELSTVGGARDELIKSLKNATDVDFDVERAKQAQQVREMQAKARAAQAEAARAAAEAKGQDAVESETVVASKGNGVAPVAAAEPVNDEPVAAAEETTPEGQAVS